MYNLLLDVGIPNLLLSMTFRFNKNILCTAVVASSYEVWYNIKNMIEKKLRVGREYTRLTWLLFDNNTKDLVGDYSMLFLHPSTY